MAFAPVEATKAQLAEIRKLSRNAAYRRETGLFCVEGPVLVQEALASALEVKYIAGGADLLDDLNSDAVPLHTADPRRLGEALSTKSPRPLVAVVKTPAPPQESDLPEGPVLAMISVADPGNAGTMLRTAEAAGMSAAFMVGDCVDQWNSKAIRASAGAVFRLPILNLTEDELFAGKRRSIIATVVSDGQTYSEVDLTASVICLGNEAHGLPAQFVKRCDGSITIPLAGPTESLNVAAAAAVVLFKALEQRRATTVCSTP